ncbi:MAG TPA: hypothetical protein VIY48_21125 [Candidatus Paceibacterota bacterium]
METIHLTSTFNVGFETTTGKRLSPPDAEDLVPVLEPNGEPALDQNGEPQMMPREGWEPAVEDVDLPTMIFADLASAQGGNGQVYKFACDPATLASVLAYFSQFLDADGRNKIRATLNEKADIVIPDVQPAPMNREQRRKLERVQ